MSRTYTITLKNNATQASQVLITNTLPAELDLDPTTLTGGAAYDSQSRQVTWQGTLAANGQQLITYQAAPNQALPPGTQIDNLLDIHLPAQSLTFQRNATYWINAPDLTHSAVIGPVGTVDPNQTILYQLVLQNSGLAPAQTTSATLRLPDALGLLTNTLQTTSGSAVISDRFVIWQGNIGLNQVITVSVMMTTPFQLDPLWLPVTAIINDNSTAVVVKNALFFLIPRQSYLPAIAKGP
jgi:uncharacterized repeat protein (TIGR01451 family)